MKTKYALFAAIVAIFATNSASAKEALHESCSVDSDCNSNFCVKMSGSTMKTCEVKNGYASPDETVAVDESGAGTLYAQNDVRSDDEAQPAVRRHARARKHRKIRRPAPVASNDSGPPPMIVTIGAGKHAECKFPPGAVPTLCKCPNKTIPVIAGTGDSYDADAQNDLDWRRAQATAPEGWDKQTWARPAGTTLMGQGAVWCATVNDQGVLIDDKIVPIAGASTRKEEKKEGPYQDPTCFNGKDDDNDGLADAKDPKCWPPVGPEGLDTPGSCDDGFDNDRNYKTDHEDPKCSCKSPRPGCPDDHRVVVQVQASTARPPSALSPSFLLETNGGFTGTLYQGRAPTKVDGSPSHFVYGPVGRLMLGIALDTTKISSYILVGAGISESVVEPGFSVAGASGLSYRLRPWLKLGGRVGINLDTIPQLRGVRGVTAFIAAEASFVVHPMIEIPVWIGPAYVWDERYPNPSLIGFEAALGVRLRVPGS